MPNRLSVEYDILEFHIHIGHFKDETVGGWLKMSFLTDQRSPDKNYKIERSFELYSTSKHAYDATKLDNVTHIGFSIWMRNLVETSHLGKFIKINDDYVEKGNKSYDVDLNLFYLRMRVNQALY